MSDDDKREITDAEIEEAAAALDAAAADAATAATESTGDNADADADEPKSVRGLLDKMRAHSGGTNVFKETMKTFNMSDGQTLKNDVIVTNKDEALTRLNQMIADDRGKQKEGTVKELRWFFRTSPHGQFGKTLDDTFMAFIIWARTQPEDSDGTLGYNVSKAFRRLVSYADWMEKTKDDLVSPPLSPESVKDALKAWGMKSSIDKSGRFVWWLDVSTIDKEAVKTKIKPVDSLRAFVWYAHYLMYDTNAQENGLVFVQNVAKAGFVDSMTIVPMKLGVKLDRLTIGVLPIRMKAIYVLETPAWMDVFLKIMGVFMSKKMKERITILKEWSEVPELVGEDCIPKNWGKLEGSLDLDPVDATFFT